MSFTYDLTTDVGRVRLAIGDTECAAAQLSDEEIGALLALADSWQAAALRAIDALIAKCAMSRYDVRLGPRSESRSQVIENLRALKAHLAASYGLEAALLAVLGSEDLTFSWTEATDEDDYAGLMT